MTRYDDELDPTPIPSTLLPSDAFEQQLARLSGLPGGASTKTTCVRAQDFYGKVTDFIVQTVRAADGDYAFITQVNASGASRYVIPPDVRDVMERQTAAVLKQIRRRQGRRLAETSPPREFTVEDRLKANAARAAKRKNKARRR